MRVLMIVALLTAGCVGAVSAQPDTAEQDQVSAADGALILEGLGPELSEIEVDLAVSKIYFEQLSNPSTSDEPLTDEVRADSRGGRTGGQTRGDGGPCENGGDGPACVFWYRLAG